MAVPNWGRHWETGRKERQVLVSHIILRHEATFEE